MPISSIYSKRILISPLNWGLGHVSRTIPIIQKLLENKNEVYICCDQDQELFYRQYFPELWYISHAGYPFRFKGKGEWSKDILSNVFSLKKCLKQEELKVKDLVEKFHFDLIISDQRFGFRSKKVKSIIISHQFNLPVSSWNVFAKFLNKRLLLKFDEIWIPDNEKNEFSGDLSRNSSKKVKYIGICSRFEMKSTKNDKKGEMEFRYLGIVSGPFPYNEQFLGDLVRKMSKTNEKCAIIAPNGLKNGEMSKNGKISLYLSPNPQEFSELIQKSEEIISRAGYTTLMDLAVLKKKAILIPTPGQQEQIYLSKLHQNRKDLTFVKDLNGGI